MGDMNLADETKVRIESELEVKSYLQDLRYAIDNGGTVGNVWQYYNFCNVFPFCREGIYTGDVPL